MKKLIKALLRHTPYRIVRDSGANRFQAIETCLRSLAARGYAPKVVIDGGAHLGTFSLEAQAIFPSASFVLIDPQPVCAAPLAALCAARGFRFFPFALSDAEGALPMAVAETATTGAHITAADNRSAAMVEARTLDSLVSDYLRDTDRALLKLDLQGYELAALRGATACLAVVEVILTEVSFFAQAYEPSILELSTFLDAAGFDLHDIASVSARPRDNRARQADLIFVRRGTNLSLDRSWA